jgi:hypothetical protein
MLDATEAHAIANFDVQVRMGKFGIKMTIKMTMLRYYIKWHLFLG